jgi:hypothetical protein
MAILICAALLIAGGMLAAITIRNPRRTRATTDTSAQLKALRFMPRPLEYANDRVAGIPVTGWAETIRHCTAGRRSSAKYLALSPPINHFWHSTLYVSARGLTTSPIPYESELFEIAFDFVEHELRIVSSWAPVRSMPLGPRSVADFYADVMSALHDLEIDVRIWTKPVEIADRTRFDVDREHAAYDADAAHAFWRVLVQVDRVFSQFRGRFLGKCSPVRFFWGGFDLAVTVFGTPRA